LVSTLKTIFYPLGDKAVGEWIFMNLSITDRPSPYFGDSIYLTGDFDILGEALLSLGSDIGTSPSEA
jgi:hypothetical protein